MRFYSGGVLFEIWKNLQMTAPSRVMFLFSCILMLTIPVLRLACEEEKEDLVAVIIMLTTAPYFLFFCRYVACVQFFRRNNVLQVPQELKYFRFLKCFRCLKSKNEYKKYYIYIKRSSIYKVFFFFFSEKMHS